MTLDNVLQKIKPSKQEEDRVKKFATELLRVSVTMSGYDCVIVGSIGKQTWLSGDHDVDLFVLFPQTVPREELEKKGLEVGKRIADAMQGKWVVKYAEHPYTRAVIRKFDVDIVPCYRIKKGENIISAVDRSPLHLEHVIENLTPAMQDSVRLLKQFCKGIGVYGSDAKNLGFSGYICELLIMRFGSFEAVLKAAKDWAVPVVVDTEVLRERQQFFDQPFVVIDPTDPKRNAAAIVSVKNVLKFIENSRQYIDTHSDSLFFPKPKKVLGPEQLKLLKARKSEFFAFSMKRPDVIDDVLYTQARKALRRIESYLKYNEFLSLRSVEHIGKRLYLIFELENWELPNVKKMVGPPIFSHKHTKEFMEKYGSAKDVFGPYVEDNRLVADKMREFPSAEVLLKKLLKMNAQELESMGIPNYIAPALANAKLLDTKKFISAIKRDKELSATVQEEYFENVRI
jgi:tRNA nucleotidyltransferase (CCA-adding enzyme)